MLRRLTIRDILLIEHVELEFDQGLNVLTGETGAGKSILLDCLGFVLGWRGRAELVRKGADHGEVEAEFDVRNIQGLRAIFDDAAIPFDEDVIIRRVNSQDGRKRAFVNDRAVSADFLRQVGELLLEIHGQHDDKGLLNEKTHLTLLDRFAEIDLGDMRKAFRDYREALKRFEEAKEAHLKAEANADYITHAAEELAKLAPQIGEEVALDGQRRLMQQGEKLAGEFDAFLQLMGGEGLGGLLADGRRRLVTISSKVDGACDESLQRFEAAYDQIAQVETDIARLADNLQYDPQRLEETEERLFAIRAAARKYGVLADELPNLAETFSQQASALESGSGQLDALEKELKEKLNTCEQEASLLSEARKAAAQNLDAQIMKELAPLKMENARFITEVSEANLTALGCDQVRFTAQTNPGAPAGSISKIASGGELSRFLLAIKLCLHDPNSGISMIFDEIDRGVGGQTADAVGRRLNMLAKSAQLLVVTHSPQVAAQGARQFIVEKSSNKDMTTSQVMALGQEARAHEIARMISGDKITEEALAAAHKLLEDRDGAQ